MRTILVAAFLLCSSANYSGADVYGVERTMRMEYDTHAVCRGADIDDTLSNFRELSDAACALRTELRNTLSELGYKFDLGERIWVKK